MKIISYSKAEGLLAQRADDLRRFLRQPLDNQVRPCEGCEATCGCSKHSKTCACSCSMNCASAGKALSIDPERYPIEPHILPLVYQLTTLRVVEPCWSCEGHPAPDGGPLKKTPQVWFHSPNAIYPQLLAMDLSNLGIQHKLSCRWQIATCTHGTEGLFSTFSIEPAPLPGTPMPALEALHKDILVIADGLPQRLRTLSRKILQSIQKAGAA